jgi:hypothetical protein
MVSADLRNKPVSVSPPNVMDGAAAVPAAALSGPVIVVWPSLATLLVISDPTSEKLALMMAAVIVWPLE